LKRTPFFACILLASMPLASAQPLRSPVMGRWGGTLTASQRAEPRTFNPVTAIDQPSRELIRLFLSDLVHINRETLRTEPALAESWRVSPDRRSIEVRLRRHVKFSDGMPLTAADVVFSFGLYLDPKLGSPQRDLLIIGGKPLTVTATSPETVRFEFAEPYAPAERLFDSLFIVPRHKLEGLYQQGKLASAWGPATPAAELIGTGPFRLAEYRAGEVAAFDRNPNYWKRSQSRALPFLDRIQMRFFADAEAEALQFRSGAFDLLTRVSPAVLESLSREMADAGFHDAGPSLEYHFLFFNLNSGGVPSSIVPKQRWFRDAAFRRAISLAVDREAIRKLAFAQRAQAIWQPVSPAQGEWFHAKLARPAMSVREARAALAAAGFSWDRDSQLRDASGEPVRFTILANAANAQHRQIATLLEQDLRALGVRLQIVPLEFRSLVDRILRTRDYDAAIMALSPGDADPGPEMSVWLSSGRSHFWNLNPAKVEPWEAEIDMLMRGQMVTASPAERRKIYFRVQEIAQREMPLICLASPHILTASKKNLMNLRRNLLPPYALANVEELYWEPSRP
jgi:peptide/nickel transport system substrate-binding protein